MTTEIKRLIQVRADKGATFKRDGYGKKRQLSDSWRKPRGQHNKQREQKKAKGALPKPGFGSPVAVRGMHPSGFFEVLLFTVKDLEGIDPKTHAIRIGATVGERTRLGLQEKALGAGFRVLNPHLLKSGPEEEKVQTPEKTEDTKQKEEKKKEEKKKEEKKKEEKKKEEKKKEEKKPAPAKEPAEPVSKDTKKEKKTPKAEEKKAPAKEKKPVKPKAEPPEKTAGEIKETTPEKTTRKTAKPKTDASAETKPKAASKPKPKKKTESEVKKNE